MVLEPGAGFDPEYYLLRITEPVLVAGEGRAAQYRWVVVELPLRKGTPPDEVQALCDEAVLNTVLLLRTIQTYHPAAPLPPPAATGHLPARAAPSASGRPPAKPATSSQLGLIRHLCREYDPPLDPDQVAHREFHRPLDELAVFQASRLIERLKSAGGVA